MMTNEQPLRTLFAFFSLIATHLGHLEESRAANTMEQTPGRPSTGRRNTALRHIRAETIQSADADSDKDPLIAKATARAIQYAQSSHQRIAVIVNHIHSAIQISNSLREKIQDKVDIVLLTDRLRPYEHDRLITRLTPFLRTSKPEKPTRPIVLVTSRHPRIPTDFSFDALVVECADPDELTRWAERLGRANLSGEEPQTATFLVRERDAGDGDHAYRQKIAPMVRVIWRCDLPDDPSLWSETVSLCPPTGGETLTLPLDHLCAWLQQSQVSTTESAARRTGESSHCHMRPALIWRGRAESHIAHTPNDIIPGDIVIIPAAYGMPPLTQSEPSEAIGEHLLDLWEPAQMADGGAPAVRLTRNALAPWINCPPLASLLRAAESPDWTRRMIDEAIEALKAYHPSHPDDPPPPPDWWLKRLDQARGWRIAAHPSGGLVLFGRPTSGRHHAATH